MQNKAKLGWTGVCGQRLLSRGAWLGRGVKRAKRTQLVGRRPHDCGLRIGDCGLEDAGRGRSPEAKCAKQTQFCPARTRVAKGIVQNEPNLARLGAGAGG